MEYYSPDMFSWPKYMNKVSFYIAHGDNEWVYGVDVFF
jgi:hypothetical protein